MKKIILAIAVILTSVAIFSFTKKNKNTDEITITVTADKQTKFDMFQDDKITKGLITPYEFKTNYYEHDFIFKSVGANSHFKINVTSKDSKMTADWPVTVLLIRNEKWSIFGID